MYVTRNFKTKKELREAVAAGRDVGVYQPFQGTVPENGDVSVEGPWSPQPHTWYARVRLEGGRIVKVVS